MKRSVLMLVTALTALSAAGCGSSSEKSDNKKDTTSATTTVTTTTEPTTTTTTTSHTTQVTTTTAEPEPEPELIASYDYFYNSALYGGELGFSEDRAWAYITDEDYCLVMFDNQGTIRYKKSTAQIAEELGHSRNEIPFINVTPCKNGYAVIYVEDEDGLIIVDKNGHETYNSYDGSNNVFYNFSAQIGDCFLVEKQERTFAENSVTLQLIDYEGKVIRDDLTKGEFIPVRAEFDYWGDGIYAYSTYVINTNNWEYINVDEKSNFVFCPKENDIESTTYSGGSDLITLDDLNDQRSFDAYAAREEYVEYTACDDYTYGEGKSFFDGIYYDTHDNEAVVPQLPEDVTIEAATRFSANVAYLKMRGADSRYYVGAIDDSGKLLYDPILMEDGFNMSNNIQGTILIETYVNGDNRYSNFLSKDSSSLKTIGVDKCTLPKDGYIPKPFLGVVPVYSGGMFSGRYIDSTVFGYESNQNLCDFFVNAEDNTFFVQLNEYSYVPDDEE